METAGDIIKDALQELTALGSEQPAPASDVNDAIRYLNRMVTAWDARGIKLGYTIVKNPSDIVTVPAGALSGIVANLAVELANSYDVPVGGDLADRANTGLNTIRQIGLKIGQQHFSGNLPIGSGNESSSDIVEHDRFFGGVCEQGDYSGRSYDPDSGV